MSERARSETLIIGGGPAGALAAALLAKSGRAVTLLEKTTEPHEKLCGDFLSGEAARPLARIGLDPLELGAVPIETLRVVIGARVIETPLPFPAYGISRRILDEAILARASAFDAEVRRGIAVRRLARNGNIWRAMVDGEHAYEAARVILATGKRELRGFARTRIDAADWLGLKMPMHLAPTQRQTLGAAIELYLFAGFYAGLQALPGQSANLCLAIPKSIFLGHGGSWELLLHAMQKVAPLLQHRLRGANAVWPQPLSIARIPYGYVAQGYENDGLLRLGDQAAVVPSFTGDGVAMALRSAEIAAEAIANDAENTQAAITASHGQIVRRAGAIAAFSLSTSGRRALAALLPIAPKLAGKFALMTRVA